MRRHALTTRMVQGVVTIPDGKGSDLVDSQIKSDDPETRPINAMVDMSDLSGALPGDVETPTKPAIRSPELHLG